MRHRLRTLLSTGTTLLAALVLAQGSFNIHLDGSVSGCTPGQTVTLQLILGNSVAQSATVTTQPNCSFSADFVADFTPWPDGGVVVAHTTCGNGTMITDSTFFNEPSTFFPFVNLVLAMGCDTTPQCQAGFTIQQANADSMPEPWQFAATNISSGSGPYNYYWTLPGDNNSTEADPEFTVYLPGAYMICLTMWNTDSVCSDWYCDTLVVDTNGMGSTNPLWYDCLGELWGPNTPGNPCDDGNPLTEGTYWNFNCGCTQADTAVDCLGNIGGSALPGTPCTVFGTTLQGIWNISCDCVPDTLNNGCSACMNIGQLAPFTGLFTSCSTGGNDSLDLIWDFSDAGAEPGDSVIHTFPGAGTYTVCLNAWDMQGNSCTICETVVVDADGAINPPNVLPCEANFWVIQAYDSTAGGIEPIPNEVWVWNLSSGGNGTYQFTWDFGDGTTSTEAFPSHTYDGPGPWLLCLTMSSGSPNNNCTDVYCDSVSVDENGILVGMAPIGGGHPVTSDDRSGGFTLNVVQGTPTSIPETPAVSGLRVWPNPADELLNIAVSSNFGGLVPVEVIAADGRVILRANHRLNGGDHQLQLPISRLDEGLYMVRIGNGTTSATQRFLKVR